jgi:NADH-quinone oxidoreductase subunit J
MGAVIALEMAAVLIGGFRVTAPPAAAVASQAAADYSNTRELGKVLYTEYLLPLQAAAALLLVAIIAAIALTLRERKDSKAVDPSLQVRVKRADRVTLLKIDPSSVAPAAPEATEEKKS